LKKGRERVENGQEKRREKQKKENRERASSFLLYVSFNYFIAFVIRLSLVALARFLPQGSCTPPAGPYIEE